MLHHNGHVDAVVDYQASPTVTRNGSVIELGRPGQRGGHSGDAGHDLFTGPRAVHIADVAAEPEVVQGTWEEGVVCFGGADGPAFDAVVPTLHSTAVVSLHSASGPLSRACAAARASGWF